MGQMGRTPQGTPSADAALITQNIAGDLPHTGIVLVNASPCDSEHHGHYNIEEGGCQDAPDWSDHFEHWLQKDPPW